MSGQEFRLALQDKELVFTTGKLAQQCSASTVVHLGGTSVLATCAMSRSAREDIDYLPLMVNYQEKYYARGVIGGVRYTRREGRPSHKATLMGRMIDRGIRPMINKYLRNDIQLILTVLSYDEVNHHDMVAANAASFAAATSACPLHAPVGTVRVGKVDGQLVLNPTLEQQEVSELDLIVTSTPDRVIMLEAGANEIPEDEMYKAIMFGKEWAAKIAQFIAEVKGKIGKPPVEVKEPEFDSELTKQLEADYAKTIEEVMFADVSKLERFGKIADLTKEAEEKVAAQDEDKVPQVRAIIDKIVKGSVRHHILESGRRIKNRAPDQIRDLYCEVDTIPRVHGAGLFQRGETQGLTITTLGSPGDTLLVEGMDGEYKKQYYHHYNFPPFSVGETSFRLFPGNREIGHGALAEKALLAVLPSKEEFPYTIRTVTEILQSNGSSSMAAACGSTLSLMAAGVPLKAPVSGVAMGMMSNEDQSKYTILTDLQDEEDFGGDMDFKVTGTEKGITAIQVDMKIKGLPDNIIEETLTKAKDGRAKILEAMLKAIDKPRGDLSDFAPRLEVVKIDPDQIGMVIGPGGKVINGIIDETGVAIDIDDDGSVTISGKEAAMVEQAVNTVKNITRKPEVGEEYDAKVVKIVDFGAFVEIFPGTEGLVHVSEISHQRTENVESVLKVGQQVKVKLIEIDAQKRLKLSMKALLPRPERAGGAGAPPPPRK